MTSEKLRSLTLTTSLVIRTAAGLLYETSKAEWSLSTLLFQLSRGKTEASKANQTRVLLAKRLTVRQQGKK
jgi:hypothetical protein